MCLSSAKETWLLCLDSEAMAQWALSYNHNNVIILNVMSQTSGNHCITQTLESHKYVMPVNVDTCFAAKGHKWADHVLLIRSSQLIFDVFLSLSLISPNRDQ